MAKQVVKTIKLQIPAGKANPAPPIGPALGSAKTQDKAGDVLPVVIYVYKDKSFSFITRQSPVSRMILKELGLESGSKVPNRDKVGKLTRSQVKKIAKQKAEDMRIASEDAALAMVMGTARSMGVDIIEG